MHMNFLSKEHIDFNYFFNFFRYIMIILQSLPPSHWVIDNRIGYTQYSLRNYDTNLMYATALGD